MTARYQYHTVRDLIDRLEPAVGTVADVAGQIGAHREGVHELGSPYLASFASRVTIMADERRFLEAEAADCKE